MTFIVNSVPNAGLRFEPSAHFADANAAVVWAADLVARGMRLVRIRDMTTGQVYDEAGLRNEIKRAKDAEGDPAAKSAL